MEHKLEQTAQRGYLERALLICWYITIGSAAFGPCLLRISLPIGGHFFLFRVAILVTCLLYLLLLLQRRENPLRGLSRVELCFAGAVVCMLVYGLVSAAWAISLGAWFSKFFTMCQMFALVFLFLKLCRDEKVMRMTLLLAGITTLLCALGGLAECFHGPFFDTPYRNYAYVFFNRAMYAPIFTFYNPNDMVTYLLFIIEILYVYMALNWEKLSFPQNKRLLYILSASMGLTLFLCCAGSGRLAFLSVFVILFGLAVWLAMRFKKGLVVFLGFALCIGFIYVGENYAQVKYYTVQAGRQIQEFFVPGDGSAAPNEPPPDKNVHATLYTILPTVTGSNKGESIQQSDGIRAALIKNSMKMLAKSRGMGIGLGNAELRMEDFDNTGGITAVHCFAVEVLLEFGVFALIPLLALAFSVLKSLLKGLHIAVKRRCLERTSNILLLLFTIIAYPLLSTASASSWGLQSMWLYIAMMLLYSGKIDSLCKEAHKSQIQTFKEG